LKLAYGTYGMPAATFHGLMDALPRLSKIGYGGVELAVGSRYGLDPQAVGPQKTREIKRRCEEEGLQIVALMIFLRIMTDEPEEHRRNLHAFGQAAELARELIAGGTPVVTTTVGGAATPWRKMRHELIQRLREYAEIAEKTSCLLAVEPHIGGGLDRPERAVWLMENLRSPWVKLNFDISHFAVAGYATEDCIRALLPHAVHAHVKDGRLVNEKVEFLLPGEGDFDYVTYFRAMRDAGWDRFVTVEVSGMVSSRPGYDAFEAARFCFHVLTNALKEAGGGP